jgi:hypothetical protein
MPKSSKINLEIDPTIRRKIGWKIPRSKIWWLENGETFDSCFFHRTSLESSCLSLGCFRLALSLLRDCVVADGGVGRDCFPG